MRLGPPITSYWEVAANVRCEKLHFAIYMKGDVDKPILVNEEESLIGLGSG